MAEFPELNGLEEFACTQTSPIQIDPLEVHAPYQHVDEVHVEQDSLVGMGNEDAFDSFNILFDSGPGNEDLPIGYDDGFEQDVWKRWKSLATGAQNNTAFYVDEYEDRIVGLAAEARELLSDIAHTYDRFANDIGIPVASLDGFEQPYPLSVGDDEISETVVPEQRMIVLTQRAAGRRDIREAYYKAGKLLWCALYLGNMSKAWKENRKVYEQLQDLPQFDPTPPESDGGLSLAPVGPQPPPQPPGFAPDVPSRPRRPRRPSRDRPEDEFPGPGPFPEGDFPEVGGELGEHAEMTGAVKILGGVALAALGYYLFVKK